ncbi:MAG: hypothetical protein H6717_29025 [Polyangiaceae bacterium]|nr:hypothetical protein [Polyangiaceae bacterium]
MKRVAAVEIAAVLSGLLITACNKSTEEPKPEPATAETKTEPVASANDKSGAAVEAKEVAPAASASTGDKGAKSKEKKCSPSGCAPGSCG